jgi:hypothetical protein
MTPKLAASETPLLKSSIPWTGHIIGILKHQAGYYRIFQYV